MVLPPEVQYVQMVPQEGWLTSTGRESWCDGPFNGGGNTWTVSCTTLGATPAGPRGSGLIAKLTLLPSQSVPKLQTIDLSGSVLLNAHAQPIPATVSNLYIKVMACPDATLDGRVNSMDTGSVAQHLQDRGVDSGAVLVNDMDASQTDNIAISDSNLSAIVVGDTISIGTEQMTVLALNEGSPDTITVARPINITKAVSHNAGTKIFRATQDNNHDGMYGYTDPRDVDDNGSINSLDYAIVARVFGTTCPAP
jgi:hypothetical protein